MSTAYYVWPSGVTFFNPVTNTQSSQYQLDPCPLIAVSRSWERNENDERLIEITNYELSSFILTGAGVNVPASGTPLNKIRLQQRLMENAFDQDFHNFIVFDTAGAVIFNTTPRVESINFPEGVWFN